MIMKIIKAIISGYKKIPPRNEPWKHVSIYIIKISHYYEDGTWDFAMVTSNEDDDIFTKELPLDCEVIIDLRTIVDKDTYYLNMNDYANVCYESNKTNNPYQHPKHTLLHKYI